MIAQSIKRVVSFKIISLLLILCIFLGFGWYLTTQALKTYSKVTSSWNELQFAYEHPSIIRSLREDYASRSAQLEDSYKQKAPTAQEKLLDELTNQLQSSK